jgi:hypothetical protein
MITVCGGVNDAVLVDFNLIIMKDPFSRVYFCMALILYYKSHQLKISLLVSFSVANAASLVVVINMLPLSSLLSSMMVTVTVRQSLA